MKELGRIAKISIRGSYVLFLGSISSTIIMAITAIIVARLLGPENYGLYTVAFIVPNLLISICDLGISPALTRYSAQYHFEGKDEKVARLIRFGLLFKITLTLIISLFLYMFSENVATHILNRHEISALQRTAIIYAIGTAILVSVNSALIGLDKFGTSSLLNVIQAVIKALASPILIVFGLGVTGAIIGTGLSVLLASILGIAILLATIIRSKVRFFQRFLIPNATLEAP